MRRIFVILFVLFPVVDYAQLTEEESDYVNSIQSKYANEQNDSVKIILLKEWDDMIYWFDPVLDFTLNQRIDSICDYNLSIENTSQKRKYYVSSKGKANNTLGIISDDNGEFENALKYYAKSIDAFSLIGDQLGVSKALNNMGNVYNSMGNHAKAMECFMKALLIREEIGVKEDIAAAYSGIGVTFQAQGMLPEAKRYYELAYKTYLEAGDSIGISGSLINLSIIISDEAVKLISEGEAEKTEPMFREALTMSFKALEISSSLEYSMYYSNVINNIGVIYDRYNMPDSSLYFYKLALNEYTNSGDPVGMISAYINIGSEYVDLKRYNEARENLIKGYEIANEISSPELKRDAAHGLYGLYKATGKFHDALEMFEEFVVYRDSITSDMNRKETIRQEFQYEFDKQHLADSLGFIKQKEIDDLAHETELRQEAQQRYLLYGGLAFLMILGGLAYRSYRRKKKDNLIIMTQKAEVEEQKNIIEEAHQEIKDSIAYAKRIQSAILPQEKIVKEYLNDSFILYKPKDVVAGDFYWLEKKGDRVLFAAADCTGHGVPGAMVSVVCHNALNRSVREYGLTNPGEILDKTREIVIQEFEKSEEEVKDGMDIALCSIESNHLYYSGANNPLLIVRKGAAEVEEIKADKQPVGRYADTKNFTTHKVDLEKGDAIYIFSDGFADQFGGEKGKKFKGANFKKLLLSIQNEPLPKQEELINEAFEQWRGDLEQVDDICVIGVKI